MASPDWDLEQLTVILEKPHKWQLVIAGPGAGKSAVACQRIAYLAEEGISPTRILVISFTRTATAELRNRIKTYSDSSSLSSQIRISTIDSQAWSLLRSQSDEVIPTAFIENSYELAIDKVTSLLKSKNLELMDFIESFEHVIVDEAQDIVGVRTHLIIEILKCLNLDCGVTILADPIQAIYGWTQDQNVPRTEQDNLLKLIGEKFSNKILTRDLKLIHRIENESLKKVFIESRIAASQEKERVGHVQGILNKISELSSADLGQLTYEQIADRIKEQHNEFNLILFRSRADALVASSYLSNKGIQHRIRISGLPVLIKPWIGWVFQDAVTGIISKKQFDNYWETQNKKSPQPFIGEDSEACWKMLVKFAAASHKELIDLTLLRVLLGRSKPPIELCFPEFGMSGPIIGTIHASKGREAEDVMLIFPANLYESSDSCDESIFEEGRVYYVGATRAKKALSVAKAVSPRTSQLPSGRVYHFVKGFNSSQVEIGRDGDVQRIAHLSWNDSEEIQMALASLNGISKGFISTDSNKDYRSFITLEQIDTEGVTRFKNIGEMSKNFSDDMWGIANIMSRGSSRLRPPLKYPHIHILGSMTVCLNESERLALEGNRGKSGFALVPIIKGYSKVTCAFKKVSFR